jgi:cytochrome b pre-mRNA-processing protein 3
MTFIKRISEFFGRPAENTAASGFYRQCVEQARRPEFYAELGVADTVDGRFDLLVLHIYLLMRHLGADKDMKQALFDLMFADMDRSLREMGVGDMGIGRRMKAMIGAFYGRAQAYESALGESSESALEQTLARNVYGKISPPPEQLKRLAAYFRRAANISINNEGELIFPQPLAAD